MSEDCGEIMSLGQQMSVDTATVLVYCLWFSTVCIVVVLVGLAIIVLPRALKQQRCALMVRTWLWEFVYVFRPRPHVHAPKVKALVAERREKRAKAFMVWMILVATYGSLETSLWLMSISPGDRVQVVVDYLAYFCLVVPLASISLSMLASSWLRAAHITQVLACLCLSAQSFFATTTEAYLYQMIHVALAHAAFSCSGVDPRQVMSLTLFRFGATVARTLWLGSLTFLLDDIWLSCFCFILLGTTESLMQSEARSMVAAMASALSEEHVEELLGTMCDAVVRLDHSLIIAPPSEKLDVLLLRTTSSAGRCFTSLMDERDQPRFLEFVTPTAARPQMLHLGMRDDCGALLSVQIFHCSIRDLDGHLWHAIGVREEEHDILPRESSPAPLSIPPAPNSDLNVRIEEDSFRSSGESCDLDPINTEGVALWIDASSEELTILRCTVGFTALVGPMAANTQFASWIKEARVVFKHWFYDAVNSLHHSECRGAQCKLRFSPPNLGHEYYYRAVCEVSLEPWDDDDEETIPVKMTLSDIEFKRGRVSRSLSSPRSRRAHGEPG